MTLEELLTMGFEGGEELPAPLADPFLKSDMLAEADLQRISWEVASDTLRILLDLKGAYQYPEANTAVIQLRGVQSLEWTGRSVVARGGWSTLMISSSYLVEGDGALILHLRGVNGDGLKVLADAIEFVEGNASGGDAPPPDYVDDDDETIRSGLTTWTSEFRAVAWTSRRVART